MRGAWWRSDLVPTGMIGVGSALAASFGPSLFTNSGHQRALAYGGILALLAAPIWRWGARKRFNGSAVILSLPTPAFTGGWEERARRHAARGFLRHFVYQRPLGADATQWSAGVLEVINHLRYLIANPADTGFDRNEPSILVSAPWPVAWALAAPWEQQIMWDVYQLHHDQHAFFKAMTVRRAMRVDVPATDRSLITHEICDLGPASNVRAVVLELGGHRISAHAQKAATASGAARALIVRGNYPREGLSDESTEIFERLCAETYSAVKDFVDAEQAPAANSSPASTYEFLVYGNPPVSIAFGLGSYLGRGTNFRLFHWVDDRKTYIEADVGVKR